MAKKRVIWIAVVVIVAATGTAAALLFVVEPTHCDDVVWAVDGKKERKWWRESAAKAQKWLDDKTGAHERRWKRTSREGGSGAGAPRGVLEEGDGWCLQASDLN